MERKMEEVIVRTTEHGDVEIAQDWHDGEGERYVSVPGQQLGLLIQWLTEAKAEIEGRAEQRD